MYESLEARRLFATFGGTVFSDPDGSTTQDTGENGMRGWTVYIDTNRNGRFDTGEPTSITSHTGVYSFKDRPAGTYLLGVVPGSSGLGQTTPGRLGSEAGTFDITLSPKTKLTAAENKAFADAAARWESIITTELPSVKGIDDLKIDITIDHIDGEGGTLGQSNPTEFRSGSDLPYEGEMEFDEADIQGLIDEGHFTDTVTHEMAHVLGFGTIWDDLGLITGDGGKNPQFTGKEATRQYDALFKTKATSVPVESKGGDGTAYSHWPEATFKEELMTGFDEDAGVAEPLSRVTVGQFADLGYKVDLDAADTWDPIHHVTTVTTPLMLGARAFERLVTVAASSTQIDENFGYRADTGPAIGTFTGTGAELGATTTLSASGISDAEGDAVPSVSFYLESNGIAGVQGGANGDTYLGVSTGRRGVYSIAAPTAGGAVGTQTVYAVASDALGVTGKKSTTITLTAPPPPTRPNPVSTTRESPDSVLLQWRDRSDDEIGFRIELYSDANYDDQVRHFNVAADSVMSLLTGLGRNATYYLRIRSYGFGGASAYTRTGPFRA